MTDHGGTDGRHPGASRVRGFREASWRRFVAGVAETLELAEGESVFDVGCGDGDFLLPLHEAGCRVGGIDPSAALITTARRLMPEGQWVVGEAAALDPGGPYDVVVACGAFQHFADHEYARGVLARMTAKATRAVAILDVVEAGVPAGEDARDQEPHTLCFDPIWFLKMLDQAGASAVQISRQHLDGHPFGEHRFHVFAKT